MTKTQRRVVVAAPAKQRLPLGALVSESRNAGDLEMAGQEVASPKMLDASSGDDDQRRVKPGRRAKDKGAKAKPVTVTLFCREYEGLNQLIDAVHAHFQLPDNMIPRSKIARLAILRLMELRPEEIWAELKRLEP